MVTVRQVKTSRDIKEFIEFPLRLYRGCESFVPPLYADERKLLRSGGCSEIADSIFLLAVRDGRTVGRIHGIHHKQYNQLKGEGRVRFTRFDSIDDKEVSGALFSALEDWARELGADTLCGPLGFSDLDREGLLIEGFDEPETFEEQYNYEYYPALVEDFGFEKEVDWLEFELRAPKERNLMLKRVAERSLEMNKLHFADTSLPKKEYINKYKDSVFDCIDKCYAKLYGTVPISEQAREELVDQFMMILNNKYLLMICDESERVVAFGLCFPNIGDALKGGSGRLTPRTLLRVLKVVKSPRTLDLGLVAVLPEYQNSGINAAIVNGLVEILLSGEVERCETNLNLETNVQVMAQWKHFTSRRHKRRRAYIKRIGDKENA